MAPPSIYGDPKITQNEETGSVLLEVLVTGADPSKTKWFLGEKELAETDTYKFSNKDEGGKRHQFTCEIKVRKIWYCPPLGAPGTMVRGSKNFLS